MQFAIREFRTQEFETVWQIDQLCFPPGISYSKQELKHYIQRPRAFTLVAERMSEPTDGLPDARSGSWSSSEGSGSPAQPAVLGFAVAESNARGSGHVITIDVMPEARRAGVGSALMAEVESRLRASGCRYVYLETAVNNRAAMAFYKRRKYELVKTIPRYYEGGLDAFLLVKPLR